MSSDDLRIAGTEDLTALIHDAIRRQYNRQISPQMIHELDPIGKHVFNRVLAWHNEGDHHRASVLIKMKKDATPIQAYLDIHEDNWNKLMTVEEAKAALGV